MANQSEALQAGLFTPKDFNVSTPARFDPARFGTNRMQQSRYDNGNSTNKQEFAKVYSQSLQKQSKTAEHHASNAHHEPKRFSPVKSDQAQSARQQSTQANNQSKPNTASSGSKSESGSNLPYKPDTREERQDQLDAGSGGDKLVAAAPPQSVSTEPREAQFQDGDNKLLIQEVGNVFQPEVQRQAAAFDVTSQMALKDNPGLGAGGSEANASTQPLAANLDGLSGNVSTTVGDGTQWLSPQTSNAMAGQGDSFTASTQNSSATTQSPLHNGIAGAQAAAPGEALTPMQQATDVELTNAVTPEDNTESTKISGPLPTLVRAVVEKVPTNGSVISSERANHGVTNSALAMTETLGNPNQGSTGEQGNADGESLSQRDTSLFRDRLYALAQQNSSPSHEPGNELKDLLARHTAQLSNGTSDSLSNDINIPAAREPSVSTRMPGSPLPGLSPVLHMSTSPDHKGWSNEIGQRVMWMLNTDLQQAQLQLNPKHLGRLEIKISMTSDQQINVSFLTHNTNAKDALDQALPRLREGFDQSGLNLNDVTVQQESRNQNREQHHSAGQTPMEDSRLAENMPEDGQMAQIFHSQSISSSIVDFYA